VWTDGLRDLSLLFFYKTHALARKCLSLHVNNREYYSHLSPVSFKAFSQQLPERSSEVAEQIERVNGDIEQQQAELVDLGPEAHLQYGPLGYPFQ
jgi:hypothetical protein